MNFRLCFKSPTSYLNCQNPDNTGEPLADDESQRGMAFETNDKIVAQLTFHTDHPFWDSTLHDSPAHFDQFAARVVGHDGGTPTVTLEDTVGLDYTAVDDALARPLRWRYCSEPGTDAHPKFTGAMAFDPGRGAARPGRRREDGATRLLRLRNVQPEHAGAPERRRPLLREAQLRFSRLKPYLRVKRVPSRWIERAPHHARPA